jgi:hypothetical protein
MEEKNIAEAMPFEKERENLADNYKHINGWGIDADPENEPTYPMKNYTGDDHNRLEWERPPLQNESVEILKSIEHPRITAVFGTVAPPSGLSGMIRRFAFKYSESTYAHWLPLVIADRVNVVEGIVDDLAHGHIPNIFAEKGWKAEWKYNRQEFVQNIAITVAVAAATILIFSKSKKKKKKSILGFSV